MYNHIIDIDDEPWDIIEGGLTFEVDEEGMVPDKKCLTPVQKKTYKKHHIVRGILVDTLPDEEYTKFANRSTTKESLNLFALHTKEINKSSVTPQNLYLICE
jgi:hypothetical protein